MRGCSTRNRFFGASLLNPFRQGSRRSPDRQENAAGNTGDIQISSYVLRPSRDDFST